MKKCLLLYLLLICTFIKSSEHSYLDAADPTGRLGLVADALKAPYTLYRAHQIYHERIAPQLAKQQYERNLALHDAIRRNQPEKVSQLIRDGAELNSTDEHGNTPLHTAVAFGRTAIVKQLKPKSNVSLKNKYKKTAKDIAQELPNGKAKQSILTLLNPDEVIKLKKEQIKLLSKKEQELNKPLQTNETDDEKMRPLNDRPSLARYQEHKTQRIKRNSRKTTKPDREMVLAELPKGKLFLDER